MFDDESFMGFKSNREELLLRVRVRRIMEFRSTERERE